ncbi:MAG: sulfotransferase [Woeseiaceae bacterium]|nr:sulfotransferase [Woeseiaceae bacterium]
MNVTETELRHGMNLYGRGRLDEAGSIFESILSRDPGCSDAWHALGMIAIVRKDHDRAFEKLSKALGLNPENPEIHQHLAVVYGRVGQFEDAGRHYREAIRIEPGYAEAYFNLSRIVRFEPGDPLIEAIENRLEKPGISDEDKSFLHFAAGKYYDDIDKTGEAFAHYRDANSARNISYDVEATRQHFDALVQTCSADSLRDHVEQGNSSQMPIFIVGMPRSGTSLVEQILASHPLVFAGGERNDMWEIAQALSWHDPARRPFPECLAGVDVGVLRECGSKYLQRLGELDSTARRVTSKNPTDFQYLGLIAGMFPNARILDVRRDSRDTCLSCFFQNFRNGQEYSFDLENLGLYYRQYERLMNHWRTVIPNPLLTVSYETLVADVEPVARTILEFCGLDWDPACAAPHKATGAVATASRWQVRKPVYDSSVKRWQRYEAYLGPLLDALDSPARELT